MSSCGNYALVGTQGGIIYKYNVQSGLSRGQYPPGETAKNSRPKAPGDIGRTMKALEKKLKASNRKSDQDKAERDAVVWQEKQRILQAKLIEASHQNAAVVGLAVDSVNKNLISVGEDAKLILWNFASHAPHKRSPYLLPAPAAKLCHIRDSDLAAIALKDYSVVLFDCSSLNIVRRFGGGICNHSGPISDLAFAPDGRTLYTASLDSTIRVWDVPTNHCVDWMAFETAPTSLTVSPTGEFLATTHADRIGISMWSDKSFYQTVFIDGARAPQQPSQMNNPVPIAEVADFTRDSLLPVESEGLTAIGGEEGIKNDDGIEKRSPIAPKPKETGLVTMSGLPPAHWKNLFHLELVKERNKPKEAPKKPPSAPFFLQWRGGEDIMGPTAPHAEDKVEESAPKEEEDAWAAAWSDDEDVESNYEADKSKRAAVKDAPSQTVSKKRKLSHHRSHLASLLHQGSDSNHYQAVADHLAMLGPSAIDVSLSTLCNGMHDLEDGLPLLTRAAEWLLEACKSRERYEAVNAYLHRFLHLHANVIAGIAEMNVSGDTKEVLSFPREREELLELVGKLRQVQASDTLKDKMQQSLCLLRHFLRMV
jgi:U3 small nucleolar RNA-associated protein 21